LASPGTLTVGASFGAEKRPAEDDEGGGDDEHGNKRRRTVSVHFEDTQEHDGDM